MATNTSDRRLTWVVLAIVGALVILPAFAMGFGLMGMGPMMGVAWHHGMWGAGDGVSDWMLVVGVGMQLLVLAVVVGAVYFGFKPLMSAGGASDPALEELRSAYARGELDDEQYERRRDRLESEH